eukprot:1295597-Prymnesium_polylepis.1
MSSLKVCAAGLHRLFKDGAPQNRWPGPPWGRRATHRAPRGCYRPSAPTFAQTWAAAGGQRHVARVATMGI